MEEAIPGLSSFLGQTSGSGDVFNKGKQHSGRVKVMRQTHTCPPAYRQPVTVTPSTSCAYLCCSVEGHRLVCVCTLKETKFHRTHFLCFCFIAAVLTELFSSMTVGFRPSCHRSEENVLG